MNPFDTGMVCTLGMGLVWFLALVVVVLVGDAWPLIVGIVLVVIVFAWGAGNF